MEKKRLCKRVVYMQLLKYALLFVLLLIGFVCAALMTQGETKNLILLYIGTAEAIIAVLMVLLPILRYKFYSYGYDDMRVYIERGIIFRHRITIPVCQIQDLHYFEGPFMLIFKLGGITFSTAGSNFELVGLDRDEAKEIIQELEASLNKRIEEKRRETLH